MALPSDLIDLLAEFEAGGVEYLLIGGHAVAVHGYPRFTKDADVWIGPSADNVTRAVAALERFGATRAVFEALPKADALDVVWMGHPPARIDLMKGVPGGDFAACYARRTKVVDEDVTISVISRPDLIAIKQASGRPQDLEDVRQLRGASE